MQTFDPNAQAAEDSGIFGLPYTTESASLVLLPVPWEATTSYGGGTSLGPQAIMNASKQVDLYDGDLGKFYEKGIAMLDESDTINAFNEEAKVAAQRIITSYHTEAALVEKDIQQVNELSEKVNQLVYEQTKAYLAKDKLVGLVGGDHSSPFGCIKAHLERYPEMGILHIDAHADLREAFEDFEYSHASIMHNVMTKLPLKKLVQVGIRDYCEAEYDFIQANNNRITTYFDASLAEMKIHGQSFGQIAKDIINQLPQDVYVSFDIDGLDPQFCPNTGTPVPGGLSYHEVLTLFKAIKKSGRRIIGFDLCEVSLGTVHPDDVTNPAEEWDANVGSRLLYKLCGFSLV